MTREIKVSKDDDTPKDPQEVGIDDLPARQIDIRSFEEAEEAETEEEAEAKENNFLKTELQSYKYPELAPLHSELSSALPQQPLFDLNNLCRPISTSRKEIEAFFQYNNSEHALEQINRTAQMHKEDQELWETFHKNWPIAGTEMEGAGLKYLSAENVIKHMNFRQYWEFRNYQIQTMNGSIDEGKVFLERLRLSRIKDLNTPLNTLLNPSDSKLSELSELSKLSEFFKLNQNLIDLIKGENLTLEDVINYLKNMHNLYQGVTITQNDTNNQAYIKVKDKDYPDDETKAKTLVTINNASSPQHNYTFKLARDLTEQELNTAIPLMIDQVHRSKEITNTHGVEIYGFLKNPQKALEIFMLLMKNGLYSITISEETLAAWRKAADDPKNNNQAAFQQALAIYHGDKYNLGLYPLACVCQKEHSEDTVKKNWEKVQKYWDKNQELKFVEQTKSSNDSGNPTTQTSPIDPPQPHTKLPKP